MYLCVRGIEPGKRAVMYLCVRGIEPGKRAVMYLCVRGIEFSSFYDFYCIFEMFRRCGIFGFSFHLYLSYIHVIRIQCLIYM